MMVFFQIVCTTCISAGRNLLKAVTFPYVLIDEAAQALEPSVLVALAMGAEVICMVGDDMQLPPFAKCSSPQIKVSLFQRYVFFDAS